MFTPEVRRPDTLGNCRSKSPVVVASEELVSAALSTLEGLPGGLP